MYFLKWRYCYFFFLGWLVVVVVVVVVVVAVSFLPFSASAFGCVPTFLCLSFSLCVVWQVCAFRKTSFRETLKGYNNSIIPGSNHLS